MRLLLIGTLRYIGRGLTFDDIEEFSFISVEVRYEFFCEFIDYGSTYLCNKYALQPASDANVSVFEKVFAIVGFNGCIGSTDRTHASLLSCPSWASISYKGHTLPTPSRNYNATVTHSRQIFRTTCRRPGSWNVKTMILFSKLICSVNKDELYSNNEFKLIELDKDKKEVEVTYEGVSLIVSNGYLNWSCTVSSLKILLVMKK